MKVAVFRVRNLDRELGAMLDEADGRCSTSFALKLDDLRERLSPKLSAIGTNEARVMRKHADKEGKGNPKYDDQGRLTFSTPDQQDAVAEELRELATSTIEIDDDFPKLAKSELAANGLATGGTRITNLRPILDLTEPDVSGQMPRASDTTVLMPAAGRVPHA